MGSKRGPGACQASLGISRLPRKVLRCMLGVFRLRPARAHLAIATHTVLPSASRNDVGTEDNKDYGAQYPACTSPCQRFNDALTNAEA